MKPIEAEAFILYKLRSELSNKLHYHDLHHTLDVVEAAERIAKAEGIADDETLALLRTAALFHDVGFITTYQSHEAESCRMAHKYLPQFEYEPRHIIMICGMIEATKIPQQPKTRLQEIICDADLDYLGRDDFETIASKLYRELKAYELVADERAWNAIQIKFLENHYYWTDHAKTTRQPAKHRHIEQLKEIANTQN